MRALKPRSNLFCTRAKFHDLILMIIFSSAVKTKNIWKSILDRSSRFIGKNCCIGIILIIYINLSWIDIIILSRISSSIRINRNNWILIRIYILICWIIVITWIRITILIILQNSITVLLLQILKALYKNQF